jgi:sugar lactone lactonase YvrE
MKCAITTVLWILLSSCCNGTPQKRTLTLCSNATWDSNPITVIPLDHTQQLEYPMDLAFDSEGSIIVSDPGKESLQKYYKDGRVTTLYTSKNLFPFSLFIDQADNIYFADLYDNTIKKLTKDGKRITTVAGNGKAGSGISELNTPVGIYVDRPGNLYVSDANNDRILKIFSQGIQVIGQGELKNPMGLYVDEDGDGSLYVSDTLNHRVVKYLPGATKQGVIVAGGYGMGNGLHQLNGPIALLLDSTSGTLFIADTGNNRLVKWAKGARQGEVLSGTTSLKWSVGMKFDREWNLYLVEEYNKRVIAFPFNTSSCKN